MPLRRAARALLAAAAVGILATLATGCGTRGTANGVSLDPSGPVLRFKPCDSNQAVRRIRLVAPSGKVVWTATATSGNAATNAVPVTESVAGYTVDDHLGAAGLVSGETYRTLVDGTDGTEWGGPTFDPADLRTGKVLVGGQRFDTTTWLADKPSCRGRSWASVAVAAVLAGLGAAAVMGLILGPLWLLRRSALRRAQEREGHLPWLHDPPPDQGTGLRRPRRPPPRS